MPNPPCQWPGCECEAKGPRSKYCEAHHRQSHNERARERRRENPELYRSRGRACEARHRDKRNARKRERRANNPELRRREAANWRATHSPESERARWARRYQNPTFRARVLARKRKNYLASIPENVRLMREFLKTHRMNYCGRLHLRSLHLPCGKHEACSGCERIGGRQVSYEESGFKFGRVGG